MKRIAAALLSLLACSAALPAKAADAPAVAASTAEGSFVDTAGNSRATTTSVKDIFQYDFYPATSLILYGSALGARSQGAVTAEQYEAGQKLEHKVDERNYLYERYRWNKDRFAGIQNRSDVSVGAGRDLWKTDVDLLSAEAGPGYVNEERIGQGTDSFVSGRAYARYRHNFSETAHFSQDAEYIQSLKDGRDSRYNTETAVTTTLTSVFSLKTSFVWHRVNRPPTGFVKDDTITSVALIAGF